MNVSSIRQDFPLLRKDKPVVYFDSACQSLRPQQVIDALVEYYSEYPACGGRSTHRLADRVTKEVEKARETVRKFIKAAKKEEIVFTRNTTEGINLIAHSLGLQKGDVVISSDKEHNSDLIPWQVLVEQVGIEHIIVPSRENNTFDLAAFEHILQKQKSVKLVAMCFTSNLDSNTIPAAEIIKLSHKKGALVLLDGAVTIAHQPIDVRKLDVDFLVFSGHKICGPSGIGVLYGKQKLLEKLSPFMVGGDTVAWSTYTTHEFLPVPEKFEAGLQDYAGIIGLGKALEYVEKIGLDNIAKHEKELTVYMAELLGQIPNMHIIGPDAKERGSITSFYIPGIDSHQIALMLSESANIMVRSGQHCVHSWFAKRNIKGSVRISLSFYNTKEEIEYFGKQLKKVVSVLG
ncbi:MAG TPA: cysteine desulfurase [Patescibacteria group bacterium]|nr:cysteine desulfurase [Patescibacteria group bacterium]